MPALSCLCATLRRVSRALTQLYEQELRPLGMRVTQLTILQVLSRAGDLTQGKLGELLSLDSTTLTRTLKIMVRQGWIAELSAMTALPLSLIPAFFVPLLLILRVVCIAQARQWQTQRHGRFEKHLAASQA